MARRKKTVRKSFRSSTRSRRRAPVRRRKSATRRSSPRVQTIRLELVQQPAAGGTPFQIAAPDPKRRRF